MPKPEPTPSLSARLLSALILAACFWFILQNVGPVALLVSSYVDEQKMAPYVAALTSGDTQKARDLFEHDIKANPKDPEAYFRIGRACLQVKRYELATEFLTRGVEACKESPAELRAQLFAALSSAYSLSEAKPKPKAIAAARQALALLPDSPDLLNALGYLLADNDVEIEEAVRTTARALQLLKGKPDAVSGLELATIEDSYAWALFKQGRLDAAGNAQSQAIADIPHEAYSDTKANGPAFAELFYHLGAIYVAQKNVTGARQALQTALSYAPDKREARSALDSLKPYSGAAPTGGPAATGADKGSNPRSPAHGPSSTSPTPPSNEAAAAGDRIASAGGADGARHSAPHVSSANTRPTGKLGKSP